MTQPTPWAHLPNAKHIDTILADVKARPGVWAGRLGKTWDMCWVPARVAATQALKATERDGVWARLWAVIQSTSEDEAWVSAWASGRALIAWDDSARMLDMSPAALRTLIDIAEGDVKHQAVLLLPAVIALHGERT